MPAALETITTPLLDISRPRGLTTKADHPPRYIKAHEDPTTLIASVLTANGAPAALADRVQAICRGVSYSSERKDPGRVASLVAQYPELAVVQDADRIDAIGAVGVGRMFTYGAAMAGRDLDGTMAHLDDKLLLLEGMAKTEVGRALMRERTERMVEYKRWWADETGFSLGEGGN